MRTDASALAGQVLIVGFPGREPHPDVLSLARQDALGGIILFKRNLGSPAEVRDLIAAHQAASASPMMVCVDQEGGRVARLRAPLLELPPMRTLAATQDEALVRDVARHLGRQLRALGFTLDFAPVLDVDTNPDNPVIGDRAFGRTPDAVIRYALAFADGLEDAGVASCGKHFPGHGDTAQDSHLALPRLEHDRARLDTVELAPFRAAAGRVPTLMSAHVVFAGIDPKVPATLSRAVMTGVLREELGWDGLTISDDLEMKAIAAELDPAEAAVTAIDAGCDALLVCSDVELALRVRARLAEAASDDRFRARLEEAAARMAAVRARYRPAPHVGDEASLLAALDPTGTASLTARIDDALARSPR